VRHLLLPDRNKRMEHIALVQLLQYIIYKNNRIMKKTKKGWRQNRSAMLLPNPGQGLMHRFSVHTQH
jgi:hypothetical protein